MKKSVARWPTLPSLADNGSSAISRWNTPALRRSPQKFTAFQALERELGSARDMQNDGDPAMREMGAEEVARLAPQIVDAEDSLKAAADSARPAR